MTKKLSKMEYINKHKDYFKRDFLWIEDVIEDRFYIDMIKEIKAMKSKYKKLTGKDYFEAKYKIEINKLYKSYDYKYFDEMDIEGESMLMLFNNIKEYLDELKKEGYHDFYISNKEDYYCGQSDFVSQEIYVQREESDEEHSLRQDIADKINTLYDYVENNLEKQKKEIDRLKKKVVKVQKEEKEKSRKYYAEKKKREDEERKVME